MNSEKTHYEVLDLPRTASADEVKKRFRELARKYHPDLHPDKPQYHEEFLQIGRAYEVLNDPSRRAAYDLTLRDQDRRRSESRSGAFGSAPTGPRAANGSARSGSAAGSQTGRPRAEAERRRQTLTRLLDDARNAFARGHLREAQRLCEEALSVGRSAGAHEMLGDIASRQGRLEAAEHHYTLAAQMTASPALIMSKLNRVIARRGGARPRDFDLPRGGMPGVQPRSSMTGRFISTFVVFVLIFFLMIWSGSLERRALGWPFIEDWTFEFLAGMAACGFLAGGVLVGAGWIRTLDTEMLYHPVGLARRTAPLGLLLGLLGAGWFPLALAAYGLIAWRQQAVSPSVVVVLGVALMLVCGFAMVAPPGAWIETLLWGGNVIFTSMLLGWFAGQAVRPSGLP